MKKALIIVSCAVLAFALVVGSVASLLLQVPEQMIAADINKHLDTPYKLLITEEALTAEEDFCIQGGFGITGYYDEKYAVEEDWGQTHSASAVLYSVTSWPDTVIGRMRVTEISCGDPAYSLYGIHAGDSFEGFKKVLLNEGFKETKNNGHSARFEKWGVTVRCGIDAQTGCIRDFTVQLDGSNWFGIIY